MDNFEIGGVTGADPFPAGKNGEESGALLLSSPRGDAYYWLRRCPQEGAPWLVLLHGAGMDHSVFRETAEYFSRSANVLTPDLPRHGMSEDYSEFTLRSCAYDVRDMLNSEGAERAYIAGHCIGGCAAQAFARLFPEYCAGLALIDTFPFGQSAYRGWACAALGNMAGLLRVMPARAFAAALSGAFSVTAQGSRRLMEIMLRQNTASAADALADTISELGTARPPEGCFPTLVMVGEHDRVPGIRILGERAAREFTVPLARIPEAGHTPYLDNPAAFRRALEDFVFGLVPATV